jgi:hypothetical protein
MKIFQILAVAGALVLTGCHDLIHEPDSVPPSAPTGLRTATGDNFIELFWSSNPENDVAGYNVFVSSSYNGRYELIGSTREPYYLDDGARNGGTYYYAVTAFDEDGNESDLSRDAAYDIPRPEGRDVVLSDFRRAPAGAGFDLSSYSVVPYDDKEVDMYFENYGGTLYMDVPTDTDIKDMGATSSILDISTAPASGWSATHDARMIPGHTYVVWTHDDHYAKFRVTNVSPTRVVFDWAYQLVPSNPMLKRAPASKRDLGNLDRNR